MSEERFYVKNCCVIDRELELPPMQMGLSKDADALRLMLNAHEENKGTISIDLECAKWAARQLKGVAFQAGQRGDVSVESMNYKYMHQIKDAIKEAREE